MSRKRKISVGIVIALVTVLTGTALALSSISFNIGTVASYDFGGYGPGFPVPATIQIQAFKLNPGETIPWHYHKGVSYVILSRGTLTEQHLVGRAQCASEEVTAGNAFVESPGQVHSVTNTGQDVAVISWATVFPKRDGIVQFNPEFKSGGIYLVTAPNCK
jgi:quercetin dioxygenase-like cupin family protein